METTNSQRMISEAIKKIALGRSIDRVNMSPSGMGGVGTARMIHGYVAKINDDPNDEYCGTIDVREFPDETASSEPITHKGVLLAGLKDNSGGFLIIPTLFSDVTIVTDAATKYSYVLNFSHADFIQILSHKESVIGVAETEELDPESTTLPTTMSWRRPVTKHPLNTRQRRLRPSLKTRMINRLKLPLPPNLSLKKWISRSSTKQLTSWSRR